MFDIKKKQPSESTADFFCAEPEAVICLKGAGVSVLSVTNNHIMENGLPVFKGTIDLLRENRITPIGFTNKNEIISNDWFFLYIFWEILCRC